MLEWYNSNLQRSYPFENKAPFSSAPVCSAIVDATFTLGEDMKFDLENENQKFVLHRIEESSSNYTCIFCVIDEYQSPVGEQIQIQIPKSSAGLFQSYSAYTSSQKSCGKIVVGHVNGDTMPVGEFNVEVEWRTITMDFVRADVEPCWYVYNTERRKSFSQLISEIPKDINYTKEKILEYFVKNIPPWKPNVVRTAPVVICGDNLQFKPGFNVEIKAAENKLIFKLTPDAGTYSLRSYIQSKIGSETDTLADIDNDGIVTVNDFYKILEMLQLPSQNLDQFFTSIQNQRPINGNIVWNSAPGVQISAIPEEHTIIVQFLQMKPPLYE